MPYLQTITKEQITNLPVEEYSKRIIIIETEDDVRKAVDYLLNFSRVGFDTETRPSFKKGQNYKIALMQLAIEDVCFLIRLNKTGIPPALQNFLMSNETLKIGLSLRDDFGAMRKRTNIEPGNFVDLQNLVGKYGIKEASLQKIYAILFSKKISKGQRLTNWEAETLTESQQRYAALDAWACLKIYDLLTQSNEQIQDIS
ncbi:MAG: 3'-5' exonuclease domain-containing protein 2 [Massilibacteroides sp.]|nr:3'-5' exonuclease domain-containing protein 2 [Massilibacteroides sp.]MDD3061461.1 3'-5' exonuclease domain-containing protein 2 [Massilibacteroides sp.]MDD4116139.1 3'-5' exonuclease domain-containing protein 2 [Massilibacteroides sp.]MDD4660211.1 3'-5' exonuclease domain-containing protein 2 [Massilibacteroides sp.]